MSDQATLKLLGSLDAKAAEALHGELTALRGRPLEIDASEVERLSGQALQVLLSAQVTWAADAQAFAIRNPSAALAETLALCGAPSLAA